MKRLALALALLIASSTFGQPSGGGSSGTARRIIRNSSLPATCSVSDVYFKTAATVGQYNCLTTNNWSLVTIGGYAPGGTDVAVADGGTGLSTLTANNVILGNGTSTPLFVAPSTSGNVLTSNGTTWQSTAPAAAGISGSLGATDNAATRADGTGTSTAQGSDLIISDATANVVTLSATSTNRLAVALNGSTSGTATLVAPATAGTTTVTMPNASSTLPIFPQQITYTGPTAARTVTMPDANYTAARTDAANTFAGTQTFNGSLDFGASSGNSTIVAFNASPPGIYMATGSFVARKFVYSGFSGSGSGAPAALQANTMNGVAYTNEGASAKNYYQLPTAVGNLWATFVVQDADGIRVVANTGDTVRIAAAVSATAGFCESTTIGDSVTFVAINATEWVAISVVGAGWGCT